MPTEAEQPVGQHGRNKWYVLAILCTGLFMLLLDGTIVNIAIPSIMTDFGTGFAEVEWVMNAYLLVFAVLLITMGRLGDLYGRRRLFVFGLVIFTGASLACGLSPGIGWLIGFRAVQGLGAAIMMPATLSIIANVFPREQRGVAMGIWGGTSGIAVSVGPSLGGVLVETASWPFIFLINIPIGTAVLVLSLLRIPESTDPTSVRQIDIPGVAVLSAALFALTFALVEGQSYGWASPLILLLFVAAAAGLLIFVLVERRQRQPLMQLKLFRSRTFAAGNLCGLILTFGMMGVLFLLPIFLQAVLGFGAIKTGLVLTPLAGVVIFASPLSGWLSDRIGSRWLVFGGMLVAALGFVLMRRPLSLETEWPELVVPFMVAGFGIGFVMAPMTSAVMGSAPEEKAGQASGVLSTMRQLGAVLGIAVMGAVLQNRAVVYVEEAVAGRLSDVPYLSGEVEQRIIEAAGSSVTQMGEMGAADGGPPELPQGVMEMLAQAPPQAGEFMRELFSRELMLGKFVEAMQTTFVAATIALFIGAIVALAMRSHVAPPAEGVDNPADATWT